MSENNNIKRFTAADIEKYHKGLLSVKEKHALEKAALDDPFLSDALEGYSTAGVYIAGDMKELNERLSERIEKAKVIALPLDRKQRFAWWKVAAIIILIAGAGFLVYQFGFNKKENSIAQNNTNESQKTSDTSQLNGAVKPETQENISTTDKTENKPTVGKEKSGLATIKKTSIGAGQKRSDTVVESFASTNKGQVNSTPTLSSADSREQDPTKSLRNDDIAKQKTEDEKKITTNAVAQNKVPNADKTNIKELNRSEGFFKLDKPLADNRKLQGYVAPNIFRGKIMDANNNPVPFANVTITKDSIGTYSDAKGNFNFISGGDTVLNVEVRSVGFNNINTQLKNHVANNQIVLQEDMSLKPKVLLDTARSNAFKRTREANANVEDDDSEPEDSWGLYNLYIVNNLRVPETFKSKPTKGDVEVSFEVDKKGEPINIKITKSLCDECDKEAIRLIKEGPKWRRKAKNGRATVTISF